MNTNHTEVQLTDLELELAETRLFSRLKNIAQMGLASHCFTTALHTRFEHSMGCLYLADRLATQLEVDDHSRQKIRLVALLHDIGSYPLSKTCEKAYLSLHPDQCEYGHEYLAGLIIRNNSEIRRAIGKQFSDLEIEEICKSITGNSSAPFVLRQMFHAAISLDSMDYIFRDLRNTIGFRPNFTALDIILGMHMENVLVGNEQSTLLCIDQEKVGILLSLARMKKGLGAYIIGNDRNQSVDRKAIQVVREMIIAGQLPTMDEIKGSIIENTELYTNYDDPVILRAIEESEIQLDKSEVPDTDIFHLCKQFETFQDVICDDYSLVPRQDDYIETIPYEHVQAEIANYLDPRTFNKKLYFIT